MTTEWRNDEADERMRIAMNKFLYMVMLSMYEPKQPIEKKRELLAFVKKIENFAYMSADSKEIYQSTARRVALLKKDISESGRKPSVSYFLS